MDPRAARSNLPSRTGNQWQQERGRSQGAQQLAGSPWIARDLLPLIIPTPGIQHRYHHDYRGRFGFHYYPPASPSNNAMPLLKKLKNLARGLLDKKFKKKLKTDKTDNSSEDDAFDDEAGDLRVVHTP